MISANYTGITTSLQEPKSKEVRIYPNPVSKQLLVETGNNLISNIQLFGVDGSILFSTSTNESVYSIDISSLKLSGMIFVKLNNRIYKVIVE